MNPLARPTEVRWSSTSPNRFVMSMADAVSEVYEPLNQYKPVARNIGIVDGPFEYLTTAGVRLPLPFTTRMTVVRLGNGDLFIHSPIAFEPALGA